MSDQDDLQYDINGRLKNDIREFYSDIKSEYLRNLTKVYGLTMLLITAYLVHHYLIDLYNQQTLRIILNQISNWTFFVLYLVLHFSLLSYSKFTPSLLKFLEEELLFLGYRTEKKFKFDFKFFFFVGFSIILFMYLNIGFYLSANLFITSFIIRIIIIYMILGISISLLRGMLYDKLVVKLKDPYFIEIEIQIRLIKRKEIESQMVRIYMTSNNLCEKSDKQGLEKYREIAEKKWLPRKGKATIANLLYDRYVSFHEYSTPINFKEHFLNLVSAIRIWDIN